VRVAVALRRGVAVVQVGQERVVVRAEVLPVEVERVLVQVVLEPHQHRLAVLRVDPRSGEGAGEPVDRRRRQRADGAGRVGVAGRVERLHGLAERVDRQYLRRGERVLPDQDVELVDDRVREPDRVRPDLVRLVAERVLLTHTRTGRQRQCGHLRRRQRLRRRRDQQRVGERVENQRARRERLDVEGVAEGHRGGTEDAVRRRETAHLQSGRHQHLAGAQTDRGGSHRPGPEDVAPGDTAAARGLQARVHDFRHKTNLQFGRTMHAPCRARLWPALRSHSGFSQSPRAVVPAESGRTQLLRAACNCRPQARRGVRLGGTPLVAAVVRAARDGRPAGRFRPGQVGTTGQPVIPLVAAR